MGRKNRVLLKDGILQKECNGPAHDEPVFLPMTEKFFYKLGRGGFHARCRLCCMYGRTKVSGLHGLVSLEQALPVYDEAVNRLGITELALRTGLTQNGIRNAVAGRVRSVRKTSFRLVALELVSARRHKEYNKQNGTVQRGVKRRVHGVNSSCTGCGGPLENYTEGCSQCWDRKRRREERSDTQRT